MIGTRATTAVVCIATLASLAARADTLTLDQCVAIALKESPDTASANFEVEAAMAKKGAARGGYSPRLRLDAGIQRWDKEMSAPLFGMLPQYCLDCTWAPSTVPMRNPDGSIKTNPDGTPAYVPKIQTDALVLRPQYTWSVGATLVQPIAALWSVYEANQLAELGIDVAQIKRKSAQRDVAYQVTEAYYRLLQAKRMADVAERSVEQVATQVKRANTFFENGAVARNDVLRAQLGLAAAQQR
jgi:outer membrane protein TolC